MLLLYIFAAVVFVNCAYLLLFSRFSFLQPKEIISSEEFPISLIICAKNEAENLKINIPIWQQQDYNDFEIILINDSSYDDTLEVLESFAKEDSRIKIVNVKNNEAFWGNKKYSLTLGIKAAKNKRMLFTDADCKPNSTLWMKKMVTQFSSKKQLILGFGTYQKKSGFLNKLIRYETLLTAIQYFSYAKSGMPYMGVGRNLAYTSNLYYENNGFMSHMKILSGDDDLFVNEVATSKNTALCFSKDSFTISKPKETWKEWSIQKKRHISTAKHYKDIHQFLLGLYFLSQILFWILAIVSLLMIDWKIPAIIIAFRFLLQWIIIGKSALKLDQKDLILLLPLWEIFLIFIQLSIFISNSTSKNTQWK
ncbi:MAG: glycosyltransferase involved in cell wall biosynthesis [Flavobacteriaceae bacterium]|jgi:glycosyltransferase involved in cell wall biosynthesis|uniref:glycosyltransferase n=1 Tax=Candidatus Marifrigoribacter sp. Uisw_064 TaxID=3230970 RepID=UPI003AEE7D04